MKNWINNVSEQRLCFRLIFGEIKRKDRENIIFHSDRFECGGGTWCGGKKGTNIDKVVLSVYT